MSKKFLSFFTVLEFNHSHSPFLSSSYPTTLRTFTHQDDTLSSVVSCFFFPLPSLSLSLSRYTHQSFLPSFLPPFLSFLPTQTGVRQQSLHSTVQHSANVPHASLQGQTAHPAGPCKAHTIPFPHAVGHEKEGTSLVNSTHRRPLPDGLEQRFLLLTFFSCPSLCFLPRTNLYPNKLLTKPAHSIINQSFDSRLRLDHRRPINGKRLSFVSRTTTFDGFPRIQNRKFDPLLSSLSLSFFLVFVPYPRSIRRWLWRR